MRACVGDGALDYLYVLMSFHFINRIADLLHVAPEAIPESLRFVEPIRRMGVRVAARLIGGSMDLKNRTYESDYDREIEAIRPNLPADMQPHAEQLLSAFETRPKIVEALRLALQSRRVFVQSHPEAAVTVERTVRESLPATVEDAQGIHARPSDAVAALSFVGTRYAQRTTAAMVDAVRAEGFGDQDVVELAVAIADANQWERCWRLAGLDAELYWRSS